MQTALGRVPGSWRRLLPAPARERSGESQGALCSWGGAAPRHGHLEQSRQAPPRSSRLLLLRLGLGPGRSLPELCRALGWRCLLRSPAQGLAVPPGAWPVPSPAEGQCGRRRRPGLGWGCQQPAGARVLPTAGAGTWAQEGAWGQGCPCSNPLALCSHPARGCTHSSPGRARRAHWP